MRQQTRERRELRFPVSGGAVRGAVTIPAHAHGIVLLVHGSGSRQRAVLDRHAAWDLEAAGFGTVSMELLEEEEARDVHNVFDAELQAARLIEVVEQLAGDPAVRPLPIGYLGTGAGAGTALLAAAKEPARVAAIVSRGGRCDLAEFWLPKITAPTMLIVGDRDTALSCNRDAYRTIQSRDKELVVIPGATHLFEGTGMLEKASSSASRWFARHLATPKH